MRIAAPLFVALTLAPTLAYASVEDEFGLGSRAIALGGAFAAVADDVTAAYYNPSGLAFLADADAEHPGREGVRLYLGLQHASPRLWLTPVQTGGASGAQLDYGTDDATGTTVGVVISPKWRIHAAFGVLLYLPLKRYFAWDTPRPDELQWPRYDDRTQHISILPAASIRVVDTLSLGVGVRVLPAARTDTIVRTEGLESDQISSGERATLGGRLAPTFSLLYAPSASLRFGLVHRRPLFMEDFGQTDITGLIPSAYVHRLAHYYMPAQTTLAVAFRPLDGALVSLEVGHEAWSQYLDAYRQRFEDAFTDVWTPRLGLTYALFEHTEVIAGYTYAMSPIVDGQRWTRFVDNEKHVLSLGTQTLLPWSLSKKTAGIIVGWHLQLHMLRERQFVRGAEASDAETGDPVADAAGFLSGGQVFNMGVSLTLEL